jgi:hypothetical protein
LQDERGADEADVARIVNPYGDALLSTRLGFVRQPHAEAEAKWPDCQPPDERRAMSLAPPSGLTVREKATTEEFR